jgi:hypothetical protein
LDEGEPRGENGQAGKSTRLGNEMLNGNVGVIAMTLPWSRECLSCLENNSPAVGLEIWAKSTEESSVATVMKMNR